MRKYEILEDTINSKNGYLVRNRPGDVALSLRKMYEVGYTFVKEEYSRW